VRKTDAEVKKEIERITNVRASARGYASYQEFIKGSQLETKVSLEDYSVSNRGLRTGLVGTPDQVAENIRELQRIGIDLLLLQCSPQREEMARFSDEVFPLVRA
jgi:FMNH2-dependent dimethyl sulfone monooxygenase